MQSSYVPYRVVPDYSATNSVSNSAVSSCSVSSYSVSSYSVGSNAIRVSAASLLSLVATRCERHSYDGCEHKCELFHFSLLLNL